MFREWYEAGKEAAGIGIAIFVYGGLFLLVILALDSLKSRIY